MTSYEPGDKVHWYKLAASYTHGPRVKVPAVVVRVKGERIRIRLDACGSERWVSIENVQLLARF